MIQYKTGNIVNEDVEALVNTVNCVGVMGRGVALHFKRQFPANFRAYRAACDAGQLRLGHVFIYDSSQMWNPRYIINFPTKFHWRSRSKLEDIEAGLRDLVSEIENRQIRSIAVPPLGSGLGGLSWIDVRPRIESAMGELQGVDVRIFEPTRDGVVSQPASAGRRPRMSPARALLIALIDRYLKGLLDPFITLLEIHKLMYFMEQAGEDLKLDFVKETHGPYSPKLRFVLRSVEGHYVRGYGDGGDDPNKSIELLDEAIEASSRYLARQPLTQNRLERVGELVGGFESGPGLELLATVHWVASSYKDLDDGDVVRMTHEWGPEKAKFTGSDILFALYVLRAQGWLPIPASR